MPSVTLRQFLLQPPAQARAWELRAATSLVRLWQQQGKYAAARQLLAAIDDALA
jgi:hypothetical protein